MNSVEDWEAFLERYRRDATVLFEREGWSLEDPRWHEFQPASEHEIEQTEERLRITLPLELRTFYLACNGWPADGWINPAINRLTELNWLCDHDPRLHQLAADAANDTWNERSDDDPVLLGYRAEHGTRVMRCLAITFSHDDQATVLLDPLENWQLGTWAHWNPGMIWTNGSLSTYMQQRLNWLLAD